MMATKEGPLLTLREADDTTMEWGLVGDSVTLGREPDNDVVLPDRQVSRYHARIERQGPHFVLSDLGSKNGTYLNGEQIQTPRNLRDGDEISVALRYRLFFIDAAATAPLFFQSHRGLRIDPGSRRVWVNGRELSPPLSAGQFALLSLLVGKAGNVISREETVRAVWPDATDSGVTDQAIDALIRRLRDRIAEVDPDHQYIVTVRGHGFLFENAT
jgi:DNA-binding response OmpR family regulator